MPPRVCGSGHGDCLRAYQRLRPSLNTKPWAPSHRELKFTKNNKRSSKPTCLDFGGGLEPDIADLKLPRFWDLFLVLV
jgi:hypothetical protein